jgi:hypothetical protein
MRVINKLLAQLSNLGICLLVTKYEEGALDRENGETPFHVEIF